MGAMMDISKEVENFVHNITEGFETNITQLEEMKLEGLEGEVYIELYIPELISINYSLAKILSIPIKAVNLDNHRKFIRKQISRYLELAFRNNRMVSILVVLTNKKESNHHIFKIDYFADLI